jgi:hypothetical protein
MSGMWCKMPNKIKDLKMIVKIHKTQDKRKIVAICDESILGKKIHYKDLQLDLSSDFYKGNMIKESELKVMIKGAYIVNAVGEKSIKTLLGLCMIKEENIKKIKNIPYVQIIINNE